MLRRDWRQDVHAGTPLKSVNQIASQSDFDWPRRVAYTSRKCIFTSMQRCSSTIPRLMCTPVSTVTILLVGSALRRGRCNIIEDGKEKSSV